MRQRTLVLAGLGFAVLLVLVPALALAASGGLFSNRLRVTAYVLRPGDALEPGVDVKYRGVVVGSADGGSATRRQVRLTLSLDPAKAHDIPAGVTARILPTTIFGTVYVDLVPPHSASPGSALAAGATIPADDSPGTVALQTAFADLYSLLKAVRPAQLDAALSALAGALEGNGELVGQLTRQLDAYLGTLQPDLPAVQHDLAQLADVSQTLAGSAPDLLRTVQNLLTTTRTVVAKQQALRTLLAGGVSVADETRGLLAQNADNLVTVVHDLQPVLAAIAADPQGLHDGVLGLDAWASSWRTAVHGSQIRINLLIPNLDGLNLVLAAGAPPGTGKSQADAAYRYILDPPEYTPEDCPRYGAMAGPHCPGPAAATASAPAGPAAAPTVGSGAEQRSVLDALRSVTGVAVPPAMAGTADLLIGPLLRGALVVVP
jgi:virulence factor Mce-like protein